MSEVTIGALDPIAAFSGQISDLIEITEAFKSHPNLRAIDYLRAAHTVRENLNAVLHATISSIMQEVVSSDRVTSEDLAAHTAEMEADMTGPEERIAKALQRIAKHFTIDSGELPPGFPGGDD